MTRILMVCTANICRSPMAQMVSTHLAKKSGLARQLHIESAGTQASRISDRPDPRVIAAVTRRDYPTLKIRSRRVAEADFARYDMILAMDKSNLSDLQQVCPAEHAHKVRMFLEFAPELGLLEMPDPYFGGPSGFEKVLELCEAASKGLIEHLQRAAVHRVQTL